MAAGGDKVDQLGRDVRKAVDKIEREIAKLKKKLKKRTRRRGR